CTINNDSYPFIVVVGFFILSYFSFFLFCTFSILQLFSLSLHDALPICLWLSFCTIFFTPCIRFFIKHIHNVSRWVGFYCCNMNRSEEHTSELQSRFDLVCRLLLEKKNYILYYYAYYLF